MYINSVWKTNDKEDMNENLYFHDVVVVATTIIIYLCT